MENINYAFDVCVNHRAVKEYHANGSTYIEGRKGSEYELKFRNKTSNRVMVIFSVDGIGVIDGKTASDKSNGYVCGAYQTITIPGWTISQQKVAKFEFNPQGDTFNGTYVECLKAEGFDVDINNQGVIGCLVFNEKPRIYNAVMRSVLTPTKIPYPNLNPPYDVTKGIQGPIFAETGLGYPLNAVNSYIGMNQVSAVCGSAAAHSVSNMTAGISEPSLGTGFGDDAKFNTSSVYFEKQDSPDWIGIVNYDTKTNLRKRGVIVDNDVSQAFPGYKTNYCYVPKNRNLH